MSGESSAVVQADAVTIVLTTGAADVGPHMPLATGSSLRMALRAHVSAGGGIGEITRFWEGLNRQGSCLTKEQLVDAVVEAAQHGRVNAWVFHDPPHITSADPDKIRADAERKAMERRRAAAAAVLTPGALPTPSGEAPKSIAEMSTDDRFFEVMKRALPRVGQKAGKDAQARFEAIINDPAILASMVATFVILLALHAVAVGAAVDGVVLAAILASAAIRGHGMLQAARSAMLGVKHMVLLITEVATAKEDKDLDRAADEVAAVVAAIGIEILMATVGKLKGSLKQSAKKASAPKQILPIDRRSKSSSPSQKGASKQSDNGNAGSPEKKTSDKKQSSKSETPGDPAKRRDADQSRPPSPVSRVPPKRAPHLRKDLPDEAFDAKTGDLIWPDGKTPGTFKDGFDANGSFRDALPPGTKLDRYGSEGGSFMSPAGTPYESRSLPYDKSKMPYRQYEVVKPLPVASGKAAPFFGQEGGGRQYKTDMSIEDLVAEGYLVERPL